MNLQTFTSLINEIISQNERIHNLYKQGVDLISFNDSYYKNVVHPLLIESFGKEGLEWIEWFIYERDGNPDIKAWDRNNNEICYDIPSLYKEISNKA
jgi:hypothetical protein